MKTIAILGALAGSVFFHNIAMANEYACDGNTCHEYVVTSEDLGEVEAALCGPSDVKKVSDGTCHQFSYCGADQGLTQKSCN